MDFKREWVIEASVDDAGIFDATLEADGEFYRLSRASVPSFRSEYIADLTELSSLRNPHPGEPGRPLPDLRAAAEAVGRALGRRFFPAPAIHCLRTLDPATTRLVLASGSADIHALPWELLILPDSDTPLAVQAGFELVRRVPEGGQGRTHRSEQSPPPLRILFVASTLDALHEARPELRLDYEAELQRIAEAVGAPGDMDPGLPESARPRLFEAMPSLREISFELRHSRAQILHLTGHGAPGVLALDNDQGAPVLVKAEELFNEGLRGRHDLAAVVLDVCESARPSEGTSPQSSAAFSLARHVPFVVGMQWPVSSVASGALFREFYRRLAAEPGGPVETFCQSRTLLHTWSVEHAGAGATGVEWATPVLYLQPEGSRTPFDPESLAFLPLKKSREFFDPESPPFLPLEGSLAAPDSWQALLPRGGFVGRRGPLRELLHLLERGPDSIVALVGTAGLGKSVLAGRVAEWLFSRGTHVVVHSGRLQGGAGALWSLVARGAEQAIARLSPVREAEAARSQLQEIQQSDLEAKDRLRRFLATLAPRVRLLLILDDFETNLGTPGSDILRRPFLDSGLQEALELIAGPPLPGLQPALRVLLGTRAIPEQLRVRELRLPTFSRGEWLLLADRLSDRVRLLQAASWRIVGSESLPGIRSPLTNQALLTLQRRLAGIPRLLELYLHHLAGANAQQCEHDVVRRDPLERFPPLFLSPDRSAIIQSLQPSSQDAAAVAAFAQSAEDLLLSELRVQLATQAGSPQVEVWLARCATYPIPVACEGLLGMWDETTVAEQWLHDAVALGLIVDTFAPLGPRAPEPERYFQVHPTLAERLRAENLADSEPPAGVAARAVAYFAHRDELTHIEREDELRAWLSVSILARDVDMATEPALRQGQLFTRYGRWADAIAVYQELDRTELQDTAEKAKILLALADLLITTGRDRDRVTDLLDQAGRIAGREDAGAVLSRVEVLLRLALLHTRLDQTVPADQYYRAATDLAQSLDDPSAPAVMSAWQALLLSERGDSDLAADLLDPDHPREDGLPDAGSTPQHALLLAGIEQKRGHLDQALTLASQALDLARQAGDEQAERTAHLQLALVAEDRQDAAGAEASVKAALSIAQRHGDRHAESVCIFKLADLAKLRGELERADGLYREALRIVESLDEPVAQAACLRRLAVDAKLRGHGDRASELIEKSFEATFRISEPRFRRPALAQAVDLLRGPLEDTGMARVFADRWVDEDPQSDQAWTKLASTAAAQGDWERVGQAVAALESLALDEQRRSAVTLLHIVLLAAHGRPEDAARVLAATISDTALLAAAGQLAKHLDENGASEPALKFVQEVERLTLENAPGSAAGLTLMLRAALNTGDLKRAKDFLAQLGAMPNDASTVDLARHAAEIKAREGDVIGAIAALEQAIAPDQLVPQLEALAAGLAAGNDLNAAANVFLRLGELDHPRRAAAYSMAGDILLNHVSDVVRAEEAYVRSLGVDPELGTAWIGLLHAAVRQRNWDTAVHALERIEALARTPEEQVQSHLQRAFFHSCRGEVNLALRQILTTQTTVSGTGVVLGVADRVEKAGFPVYAQALRQGASNLPLNASEPADPAQESAFHVARDMGEGGDIAGGIAFLDQTLDPSARNRLALRLAAHFQARGEVGQAAETISVLADQNQAPRAALLEATGDLLRYKLNEAKQALGAYERSVAADPSRKTAWLELARAQVCLGDLDDAERSLEHFLGLLDGPDELSQADLWRAYLSTCWGQIDRAVDLLRASDFQHELPASITAVAERVERDGKGKEARLLRERAGQYVAEAEQCRPVQEAEELLKQGDPRTAEEVLRIHLSDHPADPNPLQQDYLWFLRSRALAALGQLPESAEILHRLASNPVLSLEPVRQAAVLFELGVVEHRMGALDDAREHLQQSLGLNIERGAHANCAATYHQLGVIAIRTSELGEAKKLAKMSLELAITEGVRRIEASALHLLGTIARNESRGEEAEALFQQALAIFEDIGFRQGRGKCLFELGRIARERGRLIGAERKLHEAKSDLEAAGDRQGLAGVLSELGHLDLQRADLERGEDLLHQAVVIFHELGSRSDEVDCALALANARLAQGRAVSGVTALRYAARVAEEIDHPARRRVCELLESFARDTDAERARQSQGTGGRTSDMGKLLVGLVALARCDLHEALRFLQTFEDSEPHRLNQQGPCRRVAELLAAVVRAPEDGRTDRAPVAWWWSVLLAAEEGELEERRRWLSVDLPRLVKLISQGRSGGEALHELQRALQDEARAAEPIEEDSARSEASREDRVVRLWRDAILLQVLPDAIELAQARDRLIYTASELLATKPPAEERLVLFDAMARAALDITGRGNTPLFDFLREHTGELRQAAASTPVQIVLTSLRDH